MNKAIAIYNYWRPELRYKVIEITEPQLRVVRSAATWLREKKAMLAAGGFALENGKVDLRFPTMPLAEQAHKRLTDALPKGYWSITQTVGYLH